MKKSPMDVLWEELKKKFYETDFTDSKDHTDLLWQEYQIEVILRFGEDK